ncbi:hypothetical protein LCGC14_1314860 [marine sediment metagenome]|uniref:Uncharacterized protein n=1 Tax=marine sediment metagenome TaxID=412755 RepID=A0A0F9N251_9ZZZZ
MRHNELFKRLQQSSPQLAHQIELDPTAMAELDSMERERVAAEVGLLLEKFISGLFVENIN